MILEKSDLKEIGKIVDGSIEKAVDESASKLKTELRKDITQSSDSVKKIVDESEKRIISIITREVSDLADINRAVINRTDELDYRLRIVERKLGIQTR